MDEIRPSWKVLDRVSENCYLLCGTLEGHVRYAPLYIHSFRLAVPHKLLEAQLFYQQYHSYDEIENIPDRMKWCRHHLGLTQKEVADLTGISRNEYIDLETGAVDYYDRKIVDRLTALFKIPFDDLLDDYNRFLYMGQGKMIRAYRERLGLGKKALAELLQVDPNSLRIWEAEKKRMNKKSWEKYFKDRIFTD